MGRKKCQIVRNYFEEPDSDGKLRCKIGSCTSTISDHATNLLKHLEMSHPDQFTQVMMAKVEISNTGNNVAKRRKLDLIDACVRLITVHGRPFALIDDEAFQEIINAVPQFRQSQPREPINSRKVRDAVAQRNQSNCKLTLRKK